MSSLSLASADLDQIIEDVLSSFAEAVAPGPGSAALDQSATWLETFVRITGPWQWPSPLSAARRRS